MMKKNPIWMVLAFLCLFTFSCQEEEIVMPENEITEQEGRTFQIFNCDADNSFEATDLLNDTPPMVTDRCSYKVTRYVNEEIYAGPDSNCYKLKSLRAAANTIANNHQPNGFPLEVRITYRHDFLTCIGCGAYFIYVDKIEYKYPTVCAYPGDDPVLPKV